MGCSASRTAAQVAPPGSRFDTPRGGDAAYARKNLSEVAYGRKNLPHLDPSLREESKESATAAASSTDDEEPPSSSASDATPPPISADLEAEAELSDPPARPFAPRPEPSGLVRAPSASRPQRSELARQPSAAGPRRQRSGLQQQASPYNEPPMSPRTDYGPWKPAPPMVPRRSQIYAINNLLREKDEREFAAYAERRRAAERAAAAAAEAEAPSIAAAAAEASPSEASPPAAA